MKNIQKVVIFRAKKEPCTKLDKVKFRVVMTSLYRVKNLDDSLFLIELELDKNFYSNTLINSGCLYYSAFNLSFVKRHKSPRLPNLGREFKLVKKKILDGELS